MVADTSIYIKAILRLRVETAIELGKRWVGSAAHEYTLHTN